MAATGLTRGIINTILNAATATGAGGSYSVPEKPTGGQFSDYSWQTVITGAPTAVSITLQGSLDGVNWTVVDTSTATGGESRPISGKPFAFLRANLGTLTGGTAPTVTVYLILGA